jgi:hypothetical protein
MPDESILREKARQAVEQHLMIGAVLFVNEDTLLMADRTLFCVPAGMRLPNYTAGATVVVEYEVREGRNVLAHVPTVRV